MVYYLYDGTFAGLLTAVYEAYYSVEKPDCLVTPSEFSGSLFDRQVTIASSEAKAGKVYQAIKQKISPACLHHIYYAFLSELPGAGTAVYNYLKLGFTIGRQVDFHLADDRVLTVHRLSQKVGKEKHRMLGLIRFQLLAGDSPADGDKRDIYYAPIEPDHNIAILLAPHFANRLSDQNWIIHDLKRGLAVLYNQKEWVLTTEELTGSLTLGKGESDWQCLWRTYFEHIAIKERQNLRLQRQFMPVRYWRHLTEKKD